MRPTLTLFALAVLAACTGTSPMKSSESAGAARQNRDIITREQIDATASQDAFELVQRLRPESLRERGVSSVSRGRAVPVVYMDGIRRGGPEILKTLRSNEIDEIHFVSATDATTRWGSDHAAGAIEIKMRHGR